MANKTIKGGGGCSLPEDLIVDLLMRLPFKLLLKCRSVCKDWLRLIDYEIKTRPFLLLWYYKAESNLVKLSCGVIDVRAERLHSEFELYSHEIITQCSLCRGLACFFDRTGNGIFICNPTTQEAVKVPKYPTYRVGCSFGFGFLPSKNQYKIVVFFPIFNQPGQMGCNVFSFKEGANPKGSRWSPVVNQPKHDLLPQDISVNGVIYWVISSRPENSVLAFDLERERSVVIPPPSDSAQAGEPPDLIEWRGSLCMVCARPDGATKIWILINDESNRKHHWLHRWRIFIPPYSFLPFVPIPITSREEVQGEEELQLMITDSEETSYILRYTSKHGKGTRKEWNGFDDVEDDRIVPYVYFANVIPLKPGKISGSSSAM